MITITWNNAAKKAAGMAALAAKVGTAHTHDWGEAIALRGEQTVRDVIDMGGMNPTKKGGPRILSGDMFASAESRGAYGVGSAFIRAGFGINTTTPTHTLFQEGGTRTGIPAMLAIPEVAKAMEVEATDSGMRMLAHIRADWNAI